MMSSAALGDRWRRLRALPTCGTCGSACGSACVPPILQAASWPTRCGAPLSPRARPRRQLAPGGGPLPAGTPAAGAWRRSAATSASHGQDGTHPLPYLHSGVGKGGGHRPGQQAGQARRPGSAGLVIRQARSAGTTGQQAGQVNRPGQVSRQASPVVPDEQAGLPGVACWLCGSWPRRRAPRASSRAS